MKTQSGLIFRDKNGNLVDVNAIASGFLKTNGKGLITSTNDVVIGVKGQEETNYRTGQVNITRDNLGLKEGAIRDVLNMPEVSAIIKSIAGEKGLLIDQDAIGMWDGRFIDTNEFSPNQSNLEFYKLGRLGKVASIPFKSRSSSGNNAGMLAFFQEGYANGYFEGVQINDDGTIGSSFIKMYWGSVYIEEDKSAYCGFLRTNRHSTSFNNSSYCVITGAGKSTDTTGGNSTGVFVYNKTSRGFTLYNDGKSGTHGWLAIAT